MISLHSDHIKADTLPIPPRSILKPIKDCRIEKVAKNFSFKLEGTPRERVAEQETYPRKTIKDSCLQSRQNANLDYALSSSVGHYLDTIAYIIKELKARKPSIVYFEQTKQQIISLNERINAFTDLLTGAGLSKPKIVWAKFEIQICQRLIQAGNRSIEEETKKYRRINYADPIPFNQIKDEIATLKHEREEFKICILDLLNSLGSIANKESPSKIDKTILKFSKNHFFTTLLNKIFTSPQQTPEPTNVSHAVKAWLTSDTFELDRQSTRALLLF